MQLPKTNLRMIYQYLKFHDGETLLIKNIAEDIGCGQWTVSRALEWLERRNIIKRDKERRTIEVIQ